MLTPLARRWLGVVTLILGLVAMHSLVATSCHDEVPAAMTPAAMSPAAMSTAAMSTAAMSTAAMSTAAMPLAAGHQGWTGTDAAGTDCAAGHACRAVLADTTSLPDPGGVAVVAATTTSPVTRVRPLAAALTGRAPPDHGARLAQLSVWRN